LLYPSALSSSTIFVHARQHQCLQSHPPLSLSSLAAWCAALSTDDALHRCPLIVQPSMSVGRALRKAAPAVARNPGGSLAARLGEAGCTTRELYSCGPGGNTKRVSGVHHFQPYLHPEEAQNDRNTSFSFPSSGKFSCRFPIKTYL
jgi:hypothetical protein